MEDNRGNKLDEENRSQRKRSEEYDAAVAGRQAGVQREVERVLR